MPAETMTEAARRQLIRDGYQVWFERWGGPATGKTSLAAAYAARQEANGRKVVIEDEIAGRDGATGVRVWVKQ
jgi:Flp pilus assembly CpaF family ATPase